MFFVSVLLILGTAAFLYLHKKNIISLYRLKLELLFVAITTIFNIGIYLDSLFLSIPSLIVILGIRVFIRIKKIK